VSFGPASVVPFQIDLSSIARRSVASLYSHLVTRPTGRALRLGIESQIGELGAACISVLDFTQVVVLDYSCADEAVAKLMQRYIGDDRPADVYFIARGLGEQHRDPIEAVLARYAMALAAEVEDSGFVLLGTATTAERMVWEALEGVRTSSPSEIARALDADEVETTTLLDALCERRVALRHSDDRYRALSSLLLTDGS
jgi:hypothetical protein